MSLRFLTVALVGVLACIRTLAYTSPPDPSWIGGSWDDDDYDDVVSYIASFSAAEPTPACAVQPCCTPVWIDQLNDEQLIPGPALPSKPPPSPPLVLDSP